MPNTLMCIVCGLAGTLAAGAADVASADSPYSAIATRNAFNLAPIIAEPPADPKPVEQLPKLLPSGVIDIFGRPQVLFKVVLLQNSPGAQTKSTSYLLSEGEQQENVKVLQIDRQAGMVTFDNHGTIQQLPVAGFPTTGTSNKPPPTPAQILFNLSGRAG